MRLLTWVLYIQASPPIATQVQCKHSSPHIFQAHLVARTGNSPFGPTFDTSPRAQIRTQSLIGVLGKPMFESNMPQETHERRYASKPLLAILHSDSRLTLVDYLRCLSQRACPTCLLLNPCCFSISLRHLRALWQHEIRLRSICCHFSFFVVYCFVLCLTLFLARSPACLIK